MRFVDRLGRQGAGSDNVACVADVCSTAVGSLTHDRRRWYTWCHRRCFHGGVAPLSSREPGGELRETVGRSRKKTRQRSNADTEQRHGVKQPGGSGRGKSAPNARRLLLGDPIRRFVIIVALAMILFNVFFYIGVSEESLFGSYLNLNAKLSVAFINIFGDQATATGTLISSPRFSLAVAPGCDGIQASAFFIIAVLAVPVTVSWPRRIRAALIGTFVLLLMNVVRLISLYYSGIYFPGAFGVLHVDVWQGVFILLPIILWVAWVVRTVRKGASVRHAPA